MKQISARSSWAEVRRGSGEVQGVELKLLTRKCCKHDASQLFLLLESASVAQEIEERLALRSLVELLLLLLVSRSEGQVGVAAVTS